MGKYRDAAKKKTAHLQSEAQGKTLREKLDSYVQSRQDSGDWNGGKVRNIWNELMTATETNGGVLSEDQLKQFNKKHDAGLGSDFLGLGYSDFDEMWDLYNSYGQDIWNESIALNQQQVEDEQQKLLQQYNPQQNFMNFMSMFEQPARQQAQEQSNLFVKSQQESVSNTVNQLQAYQNIANLGLYEQQQKFGVSGGLALAQQQNLNNQFSAQMQPLYQQFNQIGASKGEMENQLYNQNMAQNMQNVGAGWQMFNQLAPSGEANVANEIQRYMMFVNGYNWNGGK